MKIEVATITPDVASMLLGKNTHNRHVRDAMVVQYAEDMKAGNWPLTGEAIKIDTADHLADGQHRLLACVMADVPFTTVVVWGVEPDTQRFMDKGAKRSFADTLKLAGEPNNKVVAAAAQGICAAETLDSLRNMRAFRASDPVLWETFQKHCDEMRAYTALYVRVSNQLQIPLGAVAGVMHRFLQVAPEDAQAFWDRLTDDAGHQKGDPIYQLRKQLMHSVTGNSKLTPVVKTALIIKAWNKWRNGDDNVGLLRWTAGGANPEKFPEVK